MDVTQLRYFLKTVETMNLTRAAEGLFISRQALRQMLSALERDLGRPLFDNDRNRLRLTEFGSYLAASCAHVVQEFDAMEADVRAFFREPVTLQVAVATNLEPFIFWDFSSVQEEFHRKFHHICLKVEQMPSDNVLEALERRDVDCGCVLQMPVPRQGCESTVLRTSKVVVSVGKEVSLREKEVLELEDLATMPLIGMGSLDRIAAPLWEDCKRKGIKLDYRVVPSTFDALSMIQNNLVMGLNTVRDSYDRRSWETASKNWIHIPLPGYSWEVVALCPEDRPNHAAARLLAAFLKEKYALRE